MFCTKCGKALSGSISFCTGCGAALDGFGAGAAKAGGAKPKKSANKGILAAVIVIFALVLGIGGFLVWDIFIRDSGPQAYEAADRDEPDDWAIATSPPFEVEPEYEPDIAQEPYIAAGGDYLAQEELIGVWSGTFHLGNRIYGLEFLIYSLDSQYHAAAFYFMGAHDVIAHYIGDVYFDTSSGMFEIVYTYQAFAPQGWSADVVFHGIMSNNTISGYFTAGGSGAAVLNRAANSNFWLNEPHDHFLADGVDCIFCGENLAADGYAADPREDLIGLWSGTYVNNLGVMGYTFYIFRDGVHFRAIVDFYPVEGSPPNQMSGTTLNDIQINPQTGWFEMIPIEYIHMPTGWSASGQTGVVSGDIFSGHLRGHENFIFVVYRIW